MFWGVHFLSIFIFLFKQMYLKEKNNADPYQNMFRFGSNETLLELECSLISEIKERKMEIFANNGKIVFDMLSDFPLKISIGNKEENFHFDEKNNIANSLYRFHSILESEKEYLDHLELSYQVFKIMDFCK